MSLGLSLLAPEAWALGFFFALLGWDMLRKPGKVVTFQESKLICLASMAGAAILALVIFLTSSAEPRTAFGGMYIANAFSSYFKLLFAGAFFIITPIAFAYFEKKPDSFPSYLLTAWLTLIAAFFLASSHNLFMLFLNLETLTLSLYILASFDKKNLLSIEAGTKYLVLGSLASAFMLFGISLLFLQTGTTDFESLTEILRRSPGNSLGLLGALVLISGIGFKVASVPFHLWAPDVYQGAPLPTVSILSVISKAAGFLALSRVVLACFPGMENETLLLFSVLSLLTLLYGNFGALGQTSMKRFLGYSSIAHAGYLMMGLAAGTPVGLHALLFYLAAYAAATLLVFLVVTLAERELGTDEFSGFKGLAKRSPLLAGFFFIGLLSLAGVPPTGGFFAKFMILLAALQPGLGWLVLIGALLVVVALYYYLNIVRLMYFQEPDNPAAFSIRESYQVLLWLLVLVIFFLGIFQSPILRALQSL